MKTFYNTLTNTYRMVKLLNNPGVGEYLERQIQIDSGGQQSSFGKKDAIYHRHYIIHIQP